MERFKVVREEGVDLRSEAKGGNNVVGKLKKDDEFDGEIVPDNLGFIKVLAPPPQGFVVASSARPTKPNLVPESILPEQQDAFCMLVTMAAREYGPERNYLMAAAYCASKNLTDVGTAASEKVGPFKITAEDWKKGVALAAEKKLSDFIDEDRYRWNRQPTIAALLAGACLKQLTAALGQEPTFAELYFAQLFGDGADAVLKGDRALSCSEAMKNVPPKTSYATTLKADSTKSVKAVLEEHEKDLVRALTEALIVIDRQPPDIRFFRAEEMIAPWMLVALTERDRGVEETPDPATNNERIVLYHEAAGVADKRDETPWCGSFVTFCMKQSGVKAVAESIPPAPALATSWRKWGTIEVPEGPAPVGAVVCWQPGDDSKAHVGFLVSNEVNGFVELLGGNQGPIQPGRPDAVNVKKFPVQHIKARRWFGALPGPAVAGAASLEGTAFDKGLTTLHRIFDGSVAWKLTATGLLVENEAGAVGSGGDPTTVRKVWDKFQTEIIGAAKEFGVPIELIIATICTESGGDELAERDEPQISDMSVGLMQTLINTARGESGKLGVSRDTITREWLRTPKNSIRAGTSYMATQKTGTRYDPPVVACAYNAGAVVRQDGAENRWKMRQFPIGTAKHADRFVQFFNDCFLFFKTPGELPDPSFIKALKG